MFGLTGELVNLMDWLKNVSINLKDAGPASVIVVWILAVMSLGLFGNG